MKALQIYPSRILNATVSVVTESIKVTLPNLQQLNPSILYSIVKYIFLLE